MQWKLSFDKCEQFTIRRNLLLNVNFASNKNDENKSDAYVRTIAKLLHQIPNFVSNAFKWNMRRWTNWRQLITVISAASLAMHWSQCVDNNNVFK